MTVFDARSHVFIDESKARGYYIAAAAVTEHDVIATEKELRQLVRRGQRRIHFVRESDSSRRSLLSRMQSLGVSVQLYTATGLTDRAARKLCLDALVDDLASSGATRLCMERDDSVADADRRIVRNALVRNNYLDGLRYEHAAPQERPLLWVSDAVAWCYQSGGDWLKRAAPLVRGTRRLT
ncbi:hypothetical protein [Agromyces sp. NPDC060279]|uniref:hypothetical protein n=1 Tax=Agromyces sp. NPDC060279 TaxID=3347092 RepID=UPI00364BD962